ncbi:lipoprotein signal peptidase [Candidatus Profftella armatura (Diaphorina cf. continua)]|uniref:Lipoprotein signal peptidase n=1 Tax=Candidatus Profftella armatura (Diaphorina cf. continua) TaxID=2661583 RepID=A0A7R6VZ03_9PROT|nr:signal peptidase II [Candidatus Profftella armatura (Diaphorina cf. continua)]BCG49777.1 lipoprotein signal peptidase [Candidatus Profftella armatura (Diaphorina cf. continua)]
MKKKFLWIFLSFIISFIDQLSKIFITKLFICKKILIINSFLNLFLIYNNKKIIFNLIYEKIDLQKNILIIINIIIFFLIIYFIKIFIKEYIFCYGLSFILGGAIGNFIDYVLYNYVIDFFDIHINRLHWFIFNISDISIFIGVILIILDQFKNIKYFKKI